MGFLEMDSALEIISQISWLFQPLDCLLSLADTSVARFPTVLCCWDYSSLFPCGFPHPLCLPDPCENSLFQGLPGEGGSIATPCSAQQCLNPWASAKWACTVLTSPVWWDRGRLMLETWQVFFQSSDLSDREVPVQSAVTSILELEAASSAAATSKWYTQQNPASCLSWRWLEADILATVRHPDTSSCTCPLASTESRTAAAAKEQHNSLSRSQPPPPSCTC